MQYTLRNVPAFLDRLLRRQAREKGASLNEVALEAMARGAGVGDAPVKYRNLGDLAGAWQEDPDFDEALREQDRVDESLWR
jgi:hypothetical protein